MQMVQYYQFLKGDNPRSGPGKEELLLQVAQRYAQRTGNPKSLHATMSNVPGAGEYCTRDPYFEGEEIFGSRKRMADLPPGSEHDSHRPNKVNFSRPREGTRCNQATSSRLPLGTICEEPLLDACEEEAEFTMYGGLVNPLPTPKAPYVTTIEETACDELQWHIAWLPKTSAKACLALQALTKKKCIAKIVQGNKATAAPTYTCNMDNYKKNSIDKMQFFFCNDNIERCVKGSKRNGFFLKQKCRIFGL